MAEATTIPDNASTAWGNPSWVLAVMQTPHDRVFLNNIAVGGGLPFTRGLPLYQAWYEVTERASYSGKVAGTVLAILYALETWKEPLKCEPSLALAVHCTQKFAIEITASVAASGASLPRAALPPRGHKKIEECFNSMRSVAHLWAANRLHAWGERGVFIRHTSCQRTELLRTREGLKTFLHIARRVQLFAQGWNAPRTPNPSPLLGKNPWLVPDYIFPRRIPWHPMPPVLLAEGVKTYSHRKR